MKTDALFYELFRLSPASLFELVRLDIKDEYIFESITVKTTEKRFDGFLKSKDGQGPHIFLEIQGYDDPVIYWRLFREISTWYEQNDSKTPFIAIALFIDKKYDPGEPFLTCVHPCRLIRCDLYECLKVLGDRAGILTVLKPLVYKSKENLPEHVCRWYDEIGSLSLPDDKYVIVKNLLEYAILQRIPKISLKELRKMIQLTPLEEITAVKELLHIKETEAMLAGEKKGEKRGEKKGELIGTINTLQRVMRLTLTPRELLTKQTTEQLQTILAKLEAKFQ